MARVLVVDDDADLVELWAVALRHAGHDVVTRSDGASALDAVKALGPDVSVCDVMMPTLGGVAFTGEAKLLRPDMAIVVVTGDRGALDPAVGALALARDLGADITLEKPLHPSDLVRAVEAALAASRT
jgi:CheY-like chemotaxis protein